jgi:release factor glutamine methyltransferase
MHCDPSQVYQPESDTCLLLEAALAVVKPGDRVIEIGTGSGLIASRLPSHARVVATDINPHAVIIAREKGLEVIRTDLFAGIRGLFNVILFNPPYLPTRPEERMDDWLEYALDGGESGRVVIRKFAVQAGNCLAADGIILLLVSELTGIEEVGDLFSREGFACENFMQRDAEGEMLVVLKIIRCPHCR